MASGRAGPSGQGHGGQPQIVAGPGTLDQGIHHIDYSGISNPFR